MRIQTLDKKEVDYFNKTYESPQKNYDIYILFIEKGFKLLKENGIMGFILPHKFFQGENGEKIRKFIYDNKALYKIVDFGTNQVFESATTYTCLLFLQKKTNKKFYYTEFKLGADFKNLEDIKFKEMGIERLKEAQWNFSDDDASKILAKIKLQKDNFKKITNKIFKGSSTGNDDLFLFDLIQKNNDTSIVYSKGLNQNVELENELLRPFLYGEDVRRYMPPQSKKLLLYPYKIENDKSYLIDYEELKQKYPKAFGYLNMIKSNLLKRKIKLNDRDFYKYSAARSLTEYRKPKIMIPDMLITNRISYDEQGKFYHGPAVHSVVFNEDLGNKDQYFYLAVLNSKVFWYFITHTSTALRGNAYRLTPEFLEPFCFPKIDLNNSNERGVYEKINDMVKTILHLNKQLLDLGDKKTEQYNKLNEEINRIDKEINELVYNIYGITEEEKKIIDSGA